MKNKHGRYCIITTRMYKLIPTTTAGSVYLKRRDCEIYRVGLDGKETYLCEDSSTSLIIGDFVLDDTSKTITENDGKISNVEDWANHFEHSGNNNDLIYVYGKISYIADHCGIHYERTDKRSVLKINTKKFECRILCYDAYSICSRSGTIMTLNYKKETRKVEAHYKLIVYKITKKGLEVVLVDKIPFISTLCRVLDFTFFLNAEDMTITRCDSEERWKIVREPKTLLDLCKTSHINRVPREIIEEDSEKDDDSSNDESSDDE